MKYHAGLLPLLKCSQQWGVTHLLFCFYSFLFPEKMDAIVGVPAAILGQEATLQMETKH